MARDAVHITTTTADAATASPTDGTATQANGSVFTPTQALGKYLIRVTATAAAGKNVTIKAGDNPPADAAGQGDLVVAFGAGNVTPVVKLIGPLTSARFGQDDGTVLIDYESGFTGSIEAIALGRG